MRCDACKIRFLKAPWFIGHLVRCPRWKENPKDVLDYFATVSKKKLVILKRPPGTRRRKQQSSKEKTPDDKKPPTCFTCFCGQEFLSQSLHSAHVQKCLDKVMSSKKDIQVTRKPIEPETVIIKHEVIEMDHGHYKVVFHDSKGREESSSREDKRNFDLQVTVRGATKVAQPADEQENVVVIVNEPTHKVENVEDVSHSEVPEDQGIGGDDVLPNEELDETVMQLEYFEEVDQLDDTHQENVANEVEVGTYEEEERVPSEGSENVEESGLEETATLSSESPACVVKSETTLDIEGTICECGRRLSNPDLLTEHLKVCKYYNSTKSPVKQRTSNKTVVLINCVCKAQFTKTNIKQHLLRCEVWRHVKMKKNLIPALPNVEHVENVDYVESPRQRIHMAHLRTENLEEVEQVCEESYEQEVITGPEDMIEEIGSSSITEDEDTEIQIGDVVTVGPDAAVSHESTEAELFEKEERSVELAVPSVTYTCDCGGRFRHLNVFRVHQASCARHLRVIGKPLKSTPSPTPQRVRKEDIVLKYDKPTKGEVVQRCECGFIFDSIFAYRQHQSGCPTILSKKSPKVDSLRKPSSTSQKRVSFAKEGTSKRTKVELQAELKDLVKIGTPPVQLRKKK